MRTPRAIPPERLRDPHRRLAGVDQRLVAIVRHCSRFLDPGWQIEVTSGHRPHSTGSQHQKGLAVDLQLIDPSGKYVPNKTKTQSGTIYDQYRRWLADPAFHIQRLIYPELEGRLCWGGRFTLPSGEWDVMHLDLGGDRGRGTYRAPARQPVPEIILAALRPDDGPRAA